MAFLQLCRVYGQALSQIADAEVRLFHLYVHEPLMREGVPGLQMAEEMEGLARDLLPLASPLMDYVHRRFLQHFVAQDVVGHMEDELEEGDIESGRIRVAIAFADLAGYTRFTEEEGEEEALSSVERFVEGVTNTLPEDARVVKTIGDEVMVVGNDIQAMVDWAVGFVGLFDERPEPRIGIHWGTTLYRDGDYFGREINLASRVVARARGGEVLVTDSVVEAVRGVGAPGVRGDRAGEAEGLQRAAPALSRRPEGVVNVLDAARDGGLVREGEPLLVLLSGGGDSVCLLDVALRARGPRVRAARELRAARGGRRGRGASCARCATRLGVPLTVERVALPRVGRATSRSAPATPATRWPSGSPRATTPRPTPRPTRPRPCSTGWRCHRARAPCTGWRPAAGGSCGRCWG